MKKKTIITSALAFMGALAFAQATLPSSENFNSFTGTFSQQGWSYTENPFGTPSYAYTTGGVSGSAMGRLDETGDIVTVFVGGQMGATTYYLQGKNSGGGWQGTFDVQESTNGTAWTNLASYTTASPMPTTLAQFTVTPAAASRYIRWNFTNKISGHNVSIDNINITAGIPVMQDINVKYNSTSILSGGTTSIFNSAVGTPTNVNFTVENIGLTALNISSVTFAGANASDFTVSSPATPFSVAATSNQALVVSFNPSAAGTRVADMIIANDDADEATYTIHLNAVGGNASTEPATQATNLTFSNIKSYRAVYSFNPASGGADGYIVLRKNSSSPISDIPADGVSYQRGDMVGSSKVVAVGTSSSNVVPNVWASTNYQLAVFAYNGSGSLINYNTTSPALNGFTSSGSMMPTNEYNTISTSSTSFLTNLHNLINPHTSLFYSNYANTMINLFEARDTANGQKFVECVYSSYRAVYTPPFDWTATDFSREHSYCHSWMPTFPADNPEKPEYNDQHHLFPTKFIDVNEERSNYPLGEVVTVQNTFMSAKSGQDISGRKVYEPRNAQKGNSARAIMYAAACYNTVSGNNWKLKNPISTTAPNIILYGQDQNLLKKWHFQDLPDSYEISRNDFIDSLQGNRNPFVDSVRYACYIDFSDMSYIPAPTYTTGINSPCYVAVGIKENVATHFEYVLAPNPTSNEFYLMIDAKVAEKFNLDIMDVTGRNVYKRDVDVINGFNNVVVNDLKLNSGVYFVNLHYKNEKITRKLIIQ